MKQHPRGSHRALGVAASAALFTVFSLAACGGGATAPGASTPPPPPPPSGPVQGVATPSQISVVTAK